MDRFPQRTTIGVAPLEISNISSKSGDVNTVPQCAGWILNKIAKYINKTFAGLKCMLQGSSSCVRNYNMDHRIL